MWDMEAIRGLNGYVGVQLEKRFQVNYSYNVNVSRFTNGDFQTSNIALAYLLNCTHASYAKAALEHEENSSSLVRQRTIGLLANTAALSPEELNDSENLVEEDPNTFGKSVARLGSELGFKILGGCCGTDDRHIRALAQQLVAEI